MSSEFVQNIVIRVRADGTAIVSKVGDDLGRLGSQARAAKAGTNEFTESLGAFGNKLALWAAGMFTISKGLEAMRAGLSHYDEARQLSSSITALTGSSKTAADTMAYFDRVAAKTASTGTELARVFRDVLPISMRAGLNVEQIKEVSTLMGMLAKSGLATTEVLGNAFTRLMTGHIRMNELLMITGVRIEDITKGTDAELAKIAQRVVQTALEFSKMPDTFEIAGKRIKESWLDAFAAGLAGSQQTQLGIEGLKSSLMDPKLLQAIHGLGGAFAEILPIAAGLLKGIVGYIEEIRRELELVQKLGKAGPGDVPGIMADFLKARVAGTPGKPVLPSLGGGAPAAIPATMQGPGLGFTEGDVAFLQKNADMVKALTASFIAARNAAPKQDWVSDMKKASDAIDDLNKNLQLEIKYSDDASGVYTRNAERIVASVQAYYEAFGEFPIKMRAAFNAASDFIMSQELEKKAIDDAADAERARVKVIELMSRALIEETGNLAAAREEIDRMGERMTSLGMKEGVQVGDLARLQQILEDARGRLSLAAELGEDPKKITDAYHQAWDEGYKKATLGAEQFIKAFEKFRTIAIEPAVALLTDLFTTGGKNFGSIAGQTFQMMVGQGIQDLFGAIGGTPIQDQKTGMWSVPGSNRAFTTPQGAQWGALFQKVGPGVGAGLGAGMIGLGGYYSGASDLSTIVGGGLAGASAGIALATQLGLSTAVGGWVGLVVGAVAAGIGKLLQPSKGAGYSFGVPTIRGGGPGDWISNVGGQAPGLQISWTDVQNIPLAKLKEMSAMIREQFETFWGGYLDILIKAGSKMLPKLSDFKLEPTRGDVDIGANFGKAASESYWQHWEQWISGTFPQQIADFFYEPLEKSFVSFGGSAAKFKALWDEWKGLDPKKMLELVTTLFDTLERMQKSMAFFNTPIGGGMGTGSKDPFGRGGLFDPNTLWNNAIQTKYQSFSASVADINKRIFELGDNLGKMTSQQQIAAAKEIADLMDQKMQLEKQYLEQLISMLEDANRSFQKMKEGFDTATMTPQQKYEYYQQQVDLHRQQIAFARTPQEAMQAWNDFLEDLNNLVQAGLAAGVDPATLYKKAGEVLSTVHDELLAKIHKFGDDLEAENNSFMAKFTPIWDEWLSKVDTSGSNLSNLGDGAAAAATSVNDMAAAAVTATGALNDLAAAASAAAGNGGANAGAGSFENFVLGRRGVA